MYLQFAETGQPRLARGMHAACLIALPEWSSYPGGWGMDAYAHLQKHGVEIIQGGLGIDPKDVPHIGSGVVHRPEDAVN